jgi:hypothetical protein
MVLGQLSIACKKMDLKKELRMNRTPKVRAKTVELIENNMEDIFNLGLDKESVNTTPKG